MVIQGNMNSNAIALYWPETKGVFSNYNIPLSDQRLDSVVRVEVLADLLKALNEVIGSSEETCTGGG